MKRKLNWRPGLRDHRDKKFKLHFSAPECLPASVDLTVEHSSPVRDQGQLGSCVGESSNAAVELTERQTGQDKSFLGSPMFCYFNARVHKNQDEGAQIRDSIKMLAKYGDAPESACPYIESKYAQTPSCEAYREAKVHLITDYLALEDLSDIRHALSGGNPVLLGFSCYESLMSEDVAKTGIVPMPGENDGPIGGHAICIVGYDDAKKLLKFKNSWGPAWGDKGYGYLHYEYIEKGLADDFWIVRK